MSKWFAVIEREPDFDDKEYPTDQQDWKIEIELRDEQEKIIHDTIYIVITGHLGDQNEVIPTPVDQVEDWIDAMLSGLNRYQKRKERE